MRGVVLDASAIDHMNCCGKMNFMFQRLRLFMSPKILVLGLFVVLTVVFVVCSAVTISGDGEHANESECMRAMALTNCVIPQRGYGILALASLAGLFLSLLGLVRYWLGFSANRLLALTHWQLVFKEIELGIYDFLREAFRRGVIHGQIYDSACITS